MEVDSPLAVVFGTSKSWSQVLTVINIHSVAGLSGYWRREAANSVWKYHCKGIFISVYSICVTLVFPRIAHIYVYFGFSQMCGSTADTKTQGILKWQRGSRCALVAGFLCTLTGYLVSWITFEESLQIMCLSAVMLPKKQRSGRARESKEICGFLWYIRPKWAFRTVDRRGHESGKAEALYCLFILQVHGMAAKIWITLHKVTVN